jgi:uncharacterized protein
MSNEQSFWAAVKSGDEAQVRALLEAKPGLAAARTAGGVSPVLVATYYGKPAVAEVLIALGPALDIFEAAAAGRSGRVAELLDADPGLVNAYAPDGYMPLGLAAHFGHAATVDLLLRHGADVNQRAQNAMQVQPLHAALAHGNAQVSYPIAEALLRAGAAVNGTQENGWTPLQEAAHHGFAALVALLLAHGADPTQANVDGVTALGLAEAGNHTEAAGLLRQAIEGTRATNAGA